MPISLTNVKSNLAGMLHITDTGKVANITNLLNRTAREVLHDIDFEETKRRTTTATTIYDKVYDYSAPSDLKMDKVLDIRKQVRRSGTDRFSQSQSVGFDLVKVDNTFSVQYVNGTKTLRIAKQVGNTILVDALNATTGWAVGSDATNLTKDGNNYISGDGSLNFDLSGATTAGYIESSSITAVDLSDGEDIGSFFTWVFLPSGSAVTNLILRWGDDSTNYWSDTVTSGHFESFKDGWNLVRFDWNGATQTASPTSSSVNYLRFTVTYDGTADTDIRLDNITFSTGELFEIDYYSDRIFQNSSGSYIESTSSDDDNLMLEGYSANIFIYKAAEMAAQQIQEQGGSADVQYFQQQYEKAKRRYKQQYLSEAIRPRSTYYSLNRRSPAKFLP